MLSCDSTEHKFCDVRKELMLSDRISGSSRVFFRPEMNLLCFVSFTQVWSRTPLLPIPHGSVHVTPARRFTAVQDVLSITPAAKEEQPLSLSVAAGMFLSLSVLRSAVWVAGSGHLVHVKVYKRYSRLLPLFSVGTRSYVKDIQSAHDYTNY